MSDETPPSSSPRARPAARRAGAPPRSRWSRIWHAGARFAAWTTVVIALIGLGALWFATRESTVRWAAGQIERYSGGTLTLSDVRGALLEGITIGQVRYESPDLALTIDRLAVSWFWLPPRRVQVTALEAQRVRVEIRRESDTRAQPPRSLALPISLRVTRFALGELVVARPGSEIRVAHIEGAVRANEHRIAIDLARTEAFGLIVRGSGRIAGAAPFDTALDLQATLPGVPMIAALALQASGPLERLAVQARGTLADRQSSPVVARALVRPFADDPLGSIAAEAQGVRLAAFGVAAPQALLAANAQLSIDRDGVFGGPVELRNTNPGGLQADRVPIETVRAQLRIDGAGVRFEQLAARSSEGGVLEGRIAIDQAGTLVDLNVSKLSLRGIHAAAVPVRVSGPARLVFKDGELRADARLRGADLELASSLVLAKHVLSFESITLQAGAGRIEGKGRLALDVTRTFMLDASARDFDPSRVLVAVDPKSPLAAWLDARVNGKLTVEGALTSEPSARIDAALENSRLAGVVVDGTLRGAVAARNGRLALDDVEAHLTMSENELVARGGYGSAGSILSYALRVPRLDRFARIAGVPLAGALEIDGTALGTGGDPVAVVSISGRDLRMGAGSEPALTVAQIGGDVEIQGGRVRSDFLASGVGAGAARFEQATLQARGTVTEHEIVAQAHGAAFGRPVQATLEAAGGWSTQGASSAWRGTVVRVENEGRLPVRLLAPAAVEIGAAHQRIGATALAVADGHVTIEQFDRVEGLLSTRGHFEGLAVQALARWFPALGTPKTTLTLAGQWDVALNGSVDGRVHVEREGGDLWVSTASSGGLGVERFVVDAKVRNNEAHAELEFGARRAGSIKASADTVLSRREGVWGVAGSAPLHWKFDGELSSLAWLGLLVDTPLNAEGRIVVDAERSGTVAVPVLRGTITGERMALRTFDPRAQLTDGRMRILFDDKQIALEEFVFAGRSGQLAASGILNLTEQGPDGTIDVAFERLDSLTDPLYHLVVTGAVRVALAHGQSTVTGRFRAEEARLTLRDTTAPTLGGDIVLVNGDAAGEPNPARTPFPVTVALVFELGDRFEVSGYGAQATLTGTVEIDAKAGQPLRAKGTIETTRGVYYAYGQELVIERGMLSFSGPIDNPGINFRAQRPDLSVTVGVEVTGSLHQPKARLYSQPAMPDTEILSWLALGRGLDTASRNDLQLLSLAARALLSRGEGMPLQSQLAKSFGLDEVALRSDSSLQGDTSLETTVVAVGKRLSRRLYLTFERSLAGTSTVAKLRYEVGRRWYVQTLTGTENAIDVFFTFTFD